MTSNAGKIVRRDIVGRLFCFGGPVLTSSLMVLGFLVIPNYGFWPTNPYTWTGQGSASHS
jgi:hypothetical protein